jgi:hypothetical protein
MRLYVLEDADNVLLVMIKTNAKPAYMKALAKLWGFTIPYQCSQYKPAMAIIPVKCCDVELLSLTQFFKKDSFNNLVSLLPNASYNEALLERFRAELLQGVKKAEAGGTVLYAPTSILAAHVTALEEAIARAQVLKSLEWKLKFQPSNT